MSIRVLLWFSLPSIRVSNVIGLLLNLAGIVIGGVAGLTLARELSTVVQRNLKILLAALVAYVGLRMTWNAVGGTPLQVLKQLGIALLALSLGNLTGALLRIQRGANALGRNAGDRFRRAQSTGAPDPVQGVIIASLLSCVGPLAIIGPLQQGLSDDWRTLGVKSLLDGLATLGFAARFGWTVMLSTIPILLFQGAILLAARALAGHVADPNLIDAFSATAGLIVASISLVILDLRKIAFANLLPALLYAPLLTALWRS